MADGIWPAQASGGQSQLSLPLEGRTGWENCEQIWSGAGDLETQKGTGVEVPAAPGSGPGGCLLAGPLLIGLPWHLSPCTHLTRAQTSGLGLLLSRQKLRGLTSEGRVLGVALGALLTLLAGISRAAGNGQTSRQTPVCSAPPPTTFSSLTAVKQLANGSFLSRGRREMQSEEVLWRRMVPLCSECVHAREGERELALQCWHFFQHLVAADYIIFRVVLIVSNNCHQVKVMFEVLGKWRLCWPAFPTNRLFWGSEPIQGMHFLSLLKTASSSVCLLSLPRLSWPCIHDRRGWFSCVAPRLCLLAELRLSVFSGTFLDSPASIEPAGWELSSLANGSLARVSLLTKQKRRWLDTEVEGLHLHILCIRKLEPDGHGHGPRNKRCSST